MFQLETRRAIRQRREKEQGAAQKDKEMSLDRRRVLPQEGGGSCLVSEDETWRMRVWLEKIMEVSRA